MKKIIILFSTIIIILSPGLIFLSHSAQAAGCRDCTGDPLCEVPPPPAMGALPTYNCALAGCADCNQCGCTAPAGSSSGLFPLVQCGNEGQAPCTLCDLFETANRILTFIRNIVFIIGGLMIVIGGIMMLFGGSNPGLLSSSKKIIKNTIIGLVLVMLSFIIISSILVTFAPGATTQFNLQSGGFIINCGP